MRLTLCFILATVLATAQPQPMTPETSAIVSGKVIATATGNPLRNANITLAPLIQGVTGARSFTTTTSDDGSFTIQLIPPGTYRLTAARGGFVNAEYGSRGPGRTGTPLILKATDTQSNLTIKMVQHSVIAGRVINDQGDPIDRVQVTVMRYRYQNGERTLTNAGSGGNTDDLGNYRIFGLEPGRYYVRVAPQGFAIAATQTQSQSQLTYQQTYYPSALEPDSATVLETTPGAQLLGIDFTLSKSRSYSLKAKVQTPPTGTGRMMAMLQSAKSNVGPGPFSNRFITVDAEGKMEATGLMPGPYYVTLAYSDQNKTYTGRADFTITNEDVKDLVIPVGLAFDMPVEVRVQGGTIPLTAVRVRLSSPNSSRLMTSSSGGGPASFSFGTNVDEAADEAGKLTIRGLQPDTPTLTVTGLPDGYYVKSATAGDQDVWVNGMDLSKGAPGTLTITISNGAANVEGTVMDTDGKPLSTATVILAPKAEVRQKAQRFYKTGNSTQQGRFSIRNVEPGDYKVYAFEEIESGAWADLGYMKAHESKGVEIKVTAGGNQQMSLKAIPAQ